MAKPSRKKASTTRKRTATRKPAAPKPVDVVTTAPEPEEPATVQQEPATEPVPEPEAPPAPSPAAKVEDAGPAAPFEKCQLGPVECLVGRVPLGAVLGLLNPDGLRRIEAEKSTASFESTCKRLLATDGRATPAIFEAGLRPDAAPTILHGYAELAAAEDAGVKHVTVIMVPAGGASEAQSHIVEMLRKVSAKDQPTEDDELFYRVHAEG